MTKTPRNATSAIASPDDIFGSDVEAPSSEPQNLPGNSRGRRRNTHLAKYITQVEAGRLIGVNPKAFREWRDKGFDGFNEKGHVNIGMLLEWREQVKYEEGSNQERAHQASTGTLTVAEMEAEMTWHRLMKVKREESIAQSEWVLLEVAEANAGRMLGRIRALLRVLPEVIDPELELAMNEGNSSAKRKAIIRDAVEEICKVATLDRIIHGDPEDMEDADLEDRLAAAAETENDD